VLLLRVRGLGKTRKISDDDHVNFDTLMNFIEHNPIDLPIFTVMTPLPGTALYQSMQNPIVNHDLNYYTLSKAVLLTRMEEEEFNRRYSELFHRTYPIAKI